MRRKLSQAVTAQQEPATPAEFDDGSWKGNNMERSTTTSSRNVVQRSYKVFHFRQAVEKNVGILQIASKTSQVLLFAVRQTQLLFEGLLTVCFSPEMVKRGEMTPRTSPKSPASPSPPPFNDDGLPGTDLFLFVLFTAPSGGKGTKGVNDNKNIYKRP